jgi:methylmalonyl-CoA carboxyltransferase small subunit
MTMKLKLTVDGNVYDVVVEVEEEPPPTLGSFVQAYGVAPTSAPAPAAPTTLKAPANEDKVLRAPISGTVTKVKVQAGDEVESGATLLVLEAMKMETEITAPHAGKVAEIAVSPGEAVSGGQVLVQWE